MISFITLPVLKIRDANAPPKYLKKSQWMQSINSSPNAPGLWASRYGGAECAGPPSFHLGFAYGAR